MVLNPRSVYVFPMNSCAGTVPFILLNFTNYSCKSRTAKFSQAHEHLLNCIRETLLDNSNKKVKGCTLDSFKTIKHKIKAHSSKLRHLRSTIRTPRHAEPGIRAKLAAVGFEIHDLSQFIAKVRNPCVHSPLDDRL